MDQTEFYKAIEDLQAVSPDLASLSELGNDGAKWVYLIEACNHGAKLARDLFKALRAEGKKDKAKKFDDISGRLMKAAKNTMLANALECGAEARITIDDKGESVLLVRYPKSGMIALHGINPSKLDPTIAAQIKVSDINDFTGFRRQRLAELNAQSLIGKADPMIAKAIAAASVKQCFADSVHEMLGGVAAATEAKPEDVAKALYATGQKFGLGAA